LLKKIANTYYLQLPNLISSPLQYEVLLNSAMSQHRVTEKSNFAFDIIKEVDKLEGDYRSLYSHFTSLPIKDILTTNYDYAIERTLVEEFKQENNKFIKHTNETVVSKNRHTELEGKNIFHIHGELAIPSSICLGTVHYAKNLSKIVESVTEETDGEVILKSSVFENEKLESWAEFFFKSDIYIVGLSLAECDSDLWWLLTYRAFLISKGDTRIQNKIVFYETFETSLNRDKTDCLKALGIDVKIRNVNSTDKDGWKNVYSNISADVAKDLEIV
jgi:hypothetical protein